MKIKRINSKQVRIYNNSVEVFVNYEKQKIKASSEKTFVLGEAEGLSADDVQITGQGEYEFGVAEVIAAETKESRNGTADIYKIILGRVNCVVITGEVKNLGKDVIDMLGEANVVVFSDYGVLEEKEAVIKKLSPSIVLVHDIDSEKIEKSLNLEVGEEIITAAFKAKDFEEEESAIKVMSLK